MHSAVIKMLELGKINFENNFEFAQLFSELPDKLTLEEAEALVNIFEEDDDDDYSALAWVFIFLFQKAELEPSILTSLDNLLSIPHKRFSFLTFNL